MTRPRAERAAGATAPTPPSCGGLGGAGEQQVPVVVAEKVVAAAP